MRVWGRITAADGTKTWVEVTTDINGHNDAVYITWLAQVLQLNLGESPFWANWGIPQYQTIMTQVFPDFYVMQTQSYFSGKFAAMAIVRLQNTVNPTYNITAQTKVGSIINASVEIPI